MPGYISSDLVMYLSSVAYIGVVIIAMSEYHGEGR